MERIKDQKKDRTDRYDKKNIRKWNRKRSIKRGRKRR